MYSCTGEGKVVSLTKKVKFERVSIFVTARNHGVGVGKWFVQSAAIRSCDSRPARSLKKTPTRLRTLTVFERRSQEESRHGSNGP